MSLPRLQKIFAGFMSGLGITLVSQLALPPLFLRFYETAAYGEWITLSAAVSYLGTLNFGLQTYTNNQASVYHQRGESDNARTLQGTSLLILLIILGISGVATATVFVLPITRWLKINLNQSEVPLTMYLLGLQALVRILFGFYQGSFMIVGLTHRGIYWLNAQTALSLLGTLATIMLRLRFTAIAAVQLGVMCIFTALLLIDLRKVAPIAAPSLRYARLARVKEILGPSGYFAMLVSSTFLVYQVPVLLMQRFLGPTEVVSFSITRTIYSMGRQVLAMASWSMGQDITELYGRRDWSKLLRLYDLSERVVFGLIPAITVGTFVSTSTLLAIWVRRTDLYNPRTCLYLALISGAIAIKEHKYQFQTSTNQHIEMARALFISYAIMILLSIPAIKGFGISGFLFCWLTTEVGQTAYILRLNSRLFAEQGKLNFGPVLHLAIFLAIAILLGCWAAPMINSTSKPQAAISIAATIAGLGIGAFFVFRLKAVTRKLLSSAQISL